MKDFTDHGIAPRNLKIKSDYREELSTAEKKSSTIKPTNLSFGLEDLIRPTRSTIGVKMLRKMGWREGQGIGPKIKRKLRKLKSKIAHGE